MTKRQLLTTLKTVPEESKASVVCAMIGHSKIISLCFGYVNCARCDARIGDLFGSVFDTTDSVIMRHNCETCQENFKKLGWKDLYLCPDPFAVEDVPQPDNASALFLAIKGTVFIDRYEKRPFDRRTDSTDTGSIA